MIENYTRLLVENILQHPADFEWSAQGLGMLRMYLKKPDVRIHVWDSQLRVPGVSALHTHPWHFDSLVIAGSLRNRRYREKEYEETYSHVLHEYNSVEITCGESACTHGEPQKVWLSEDGLENYWPGQTYHQQKDEIHLSLPEDGTVTVVKRTVPEGTSPDKAKVFWRGKGMWVDAKPRPATKEEVVQITDRALQTWF